VDGVVSFVLPFLLWLAWWCVRRIGLTVCRQIWGFATVNGERWLVRKFAIRRKDKDEVVRIRLCYEWAGELDS
jgi:hypothetical protein